MRRPFFTLSLILAYSVGISGCSEGHHEGKGQSTNHSSLNPSTQGSEATLGSTTEQSTASIDPATTSSASASSSVSASTLTSTSLSSSSGSSSSSTAPSSSNASSSSNAPTGTTTPSTNGCGPKILITATFRDFSIREENGVPKHPDFESFGGSGQTGLVQKRLDAEHKPLVALPVDTSQITSEASFHQWYRDIDGVNHTFVRNLEFNETESEIYEYASSSFFPIGPNEGWGKQQHDRNYGFTTEIAIDFIYREGQTFEFRGDDDLWLFIDDQLALDIGGLHTELERTLDLDVEGPKLGLQLNHSYTMRIFHAERHATGSNFKVKSNIGCIFEPG